MKILSFDQALGTTGWAFFEDDKLVDSGAFSISKTKRIDKRLNDFIDTFGTLVWEYQPDAIAFEDIQNQQNNETYKKLAYIQAIILMWCGKHDIPYSILSPSHWRSVLGIKGRKREEQKAAAIDYVKNKCGKSVMSDEADAVCIGLAYIEEDKKNRSAF